MESKLKNDRRALGTLILFKVLENKKQKIDRQKSIWQAYLSLSEVLGDDFMNLRDFEHFYLKLENGECDLDYDGKPTYNRNLGDLPPHVLKLITGKLTDEEKWTFRESSLSIRTLIDPYVPGFAGLEIDISGRHRKVIFNSNDERMLEIDYSEEASQESGDVKKVYRSLMCKRVETIGKTVEELMIEDIRQMMDNPKTRLVDLQISAASFQELDFFDNLKPILESQKNIQKIFFYTNAPTHFQPILNSLKPGTLEKIELSTDKKNLDLSGILEMDQVKQAKRVKIRCHRATYPLSHLMHLEEFEGGRDSLEPQEVLAIKNESTRTGQMKRFRIQPAMGMPNQEINDALGPLNPEFNDTAERRHFRIQNSDELMKLEICMRFLEFSRVTTVENEVPRI